jgi:hypothetical protein
VGCNSTAQKLDVLAVVREQPLLVQRHVERIKIRLMQVRLRVTRGDGVTGRYAHDRSEEEFIGVLSHLTSQRASVRVEGRYARLPSGGALSAVVPRVKLVALARLEGLVA